MQLYNLPFIAPKHKCSKLNLSVQSGCYYRKKKRVKVWVCNPTSSGLLPPTKTPRPPPYSDTHIYTHTPDCFYDPTLMTTRAHSMQNGHWIKNIFVIMKYLKDPKNVHTFRKFLIMHSQAPAGFQCKPHGWGFNIKLSYYLHILIQVHLFKISDLTPTLFNLHIRHLHWYKCLLM